MGKSIQFDKHLFDFNSNRSAEPILRHSLFICRWGHGRTRGFAPTALIGGTVGLGRTRGFAPTGLDGNASVNFAATGRMCPAPTKFDEGLPINFAAAVVDRSG